jgi:hypothetical protein
MSRPTTRAAAVAGAAFAQATALHVASQEGHIEVARLLLAHSDVGSDGLSVSAVGLDFEGQRAGG